MCYACTQCGKCGKFGEGENLASMVSIPCLKCGAVVNPFNGICTECGRRAFIPAGSSSRQTKTTR
jgi:uncharacterized OB-fold protein